MAHLARRAADFGVTIAGPVGVDYAAVRARMMAVVQSSRDSLGQWVAGTPGLSLVHGEARFVAPDAVRVGERTLQAPRIFLNVGARPVVPDWIADSGAPFLTSESLMALTQLPTQLVILGAGYIALEYAQVYARFGCAVTVIEHGERLRPENILEQGIGAGLCHARCFACFAAAWQAGSDGSPKPPKNRMHPPANMLTGEAGWR